MNKTLIIGVAIIVLGLGAWVFRPADGNMGPAGPMGPSGPRAGAVSSPDINSPYIGWGGVRHFAARTDTLTQASTTLCALQSPAATSTLEFATLHIDVASSTATTVVMAKSATAFATTTAIETRTLASAAELNLVASSTGRTSGLPVFSPNTWLVVSQSGGGFAGSTFSENGTCQAIWGVMSV